MTVISLSLYWQFVIIYSTWAVKLIDILIIVIMRYSHGISKRELTQIDHSVSSIQIITLNGISYNSHYCSLYFFLILTCYSTHCIRESHKLIFDVFKRYGKMQLKKKQTARKRTIYIRIRHQWDVTNTTLVNIVWLELWVTDLE